MLTKIDSSGVILIKLCTQSFEHGCYYIYCEWPWLTTLHWVANSKFHLADTFLKYNVLKMFSCSYFWCYLLPVTLLG